MLPLQDVVPSGGVPVATIALVIVNVVVFAGQLLTNAFPSTVLLSPFAHLSALHFVVTMGFLWLFGDNVEARLGRVMFVALYCLSAAAGTCFAGALTGGFVPIGAASAVTGILGAYFVLLPKSRVLVFIPAPLNLAEAPALFFLGVWGLLHAVGFVTGPRAAPSLLLPLVACLLIGAATGVATRRRVEW